MGGGMAQHPKVEAGALCGAAQWSSDCTQATLSEGLNWLTWQALRHP